MLLMIKISILKLKTHSLGSEHFLYGFH